MSPAQGGRSHWRGLAPCRRCGSRRQSRSDPPPRDPRPPEQQISVTLQREAVSNRRVRRIKLSGEH